MSMMLLGLSVFTIFLAITSYHKQLWEFLVRTLHPLAPYESWLTIAILLFVIVAFYLARRITKSEDKLKGFYNPHYKTVD